MIRDFASPVLGRNRPITSDQVMQGRQSKTDKNEVEDFDMACHQSCRCHGSEQASAHVAQASASVIDIRDDLFVCK
jgi:hypothetical protein